MQVLESRIEQQFTAGLKALKLISIKLNLRGSAGWPDRMVLLPGGRPFFVELKREGWEPRKLQVHRISQLRSLGYLAEVHDNATDAIAAIMREVDAIRVSEARR